MYRQIMSPGWTLGWTWAKKEVIWSMVGAQATDQGDCSNFKGNIPHCCKRNPTVIDLLPGVPKTQQYSDCCKGGVLASWGQDPTAAVSSFQLSVGLSGTSNTTVAPPQNFFLLGPGPGYTCSAATIVSPSVFFSSDGQRKTQAMSELVFLLKSPLASVVPAYRVLILWLSVSIILQWPGLWHALTRKCLCLRIPPVVFLCHPFTTLRSLPVRPVLVGARIMKILAVSCKKSRSLEKQVKCIWRCID